MHAIWSSAPAPTAAGDRAGKQNRQFIGALALSPLTGCMTVEVVTPALLWLG
jgi:hypothetical protein